MQFGSSQVITPQRPRSLESMDALDYIGQLNGRYWDEYGQWFPAGLANYPVFGSRNSRQWGRDRYTFWTEQQLNMQRDAARFLAENDPLAVGVLGQLVNFTVGEEPQVMVALKKGKKNKEAVELVQGRIDAFKERIAEESGFAVTFEEWVREYCSSAITDGVKADRLYPQRQGAIVRRIEPEQITQPPGGTDQDGWHMGVLCEKNDITKRLGFYVKYAPGESAGEFVSAKDLIFYTRNTPTTVVWGVSDFLPVTDDLADIGRLIDGIRVGSKAKAKIAYIRSVKGIPQSDLEGWVNAQRDTNQPSSTPGSGRNLSKETLPPGTVINAGDAVDFKTMPQGSTLEYIAAANFCIRSVLAVRWGLPEYMVNSDASNNNYASIMVSGGPAVRAFKANQSAIGARIRLIIKRVLEYDCALGLLPMGILNDVNIVIKFPSPVISDPFADAQVKQIELQNKVRSRHSWIASNGEDPEEVDQQILEDQQMQTSASPLPDVAGILKMGE